MEENPNVTLQGMFRERVKMTDLTRILALIDSDPKLSRLEHKSWHSHPTLSSEASPS